MPWSVSAAAVASKPAFESTATRRPAASRPSSSVNVVTSSSNWSRLEATTAPAARASSSQTS